MLFGLIQYVAGRKKLQSAFDRIAASGSTAKAVTHTEAAHHTSDWARISAIVIFFLFAILFWGGYEQAGSTLNLFADRYTRLEVLGMSFPSSWFQSVQPFFLIALAPVFAWLWIRLGSRQPSLTAKFGLGLFFMGLSFLVLIPAAAVAQGQGIRVSPWWLVLSYAISEFGEICIYPVGMSAVSKLAPPRIVGLMMGVWFLSISFGNKLAGWVAGFIESMPLQTLFALMTAVLVLAGLVMAILIKPVSRLTGERR
jgi:POT family proton-dependent oligopeptide transporter